ncbi:MAG TPA: hypothetical protein VGG48_10990 [Rhizomicrobium sp.]|jgi:chromosomal replication initiation ATPase DnaA
MSPQLPLPLPPATPKLSRADFLVAPANAEAVAFIDLWPNWTVASAALYGPSGSGKSHLAGAWAANALVMQAAAIDPDVPLQPIVIEDVDGVRASLKRDGALFSLLERATRGAPVLLTGLEPPAAWDVALPDLASRFAALLAFPLWAPDDALLAALARKLFTDRQLTVPDAVIARMLRSLERTPAAVRAFVAEADARALAEKKPVSVSLVQELMR